MTRMSFHFAQRRLFPVWLAVGLMGLLMPPAVDADDRVNQSHDPAVQRSILAHEIARRLEKKIETLFPDSRIYLIPLNGQLLVKGQAKTAAESARILQIVRGAVETLDLKTPIVNMLESPSPGQVMLHLKIVEIKRAQLAAIETAMEAMHDDIEIGSGGGPGVYRVLENEAVNKLFNQVTSKGMGKVLAAPTLAVLSGHAASFFTGGEFPVPTIVGLSGVPGTPNSFRGFGQSLTVKPEVIGSGWIKLNITPEFTAPNDMHTAARTQSGGRRVAGGETA